VKLIVAGSRTINLNTTMVDELLWQFGVQDQVEEVVSGCATGMDTSGEQWVKNLHHRYPVRRVKLTTFPPLWETHGKAAGIIRNRQMAEYADALLLVWDGASKGSKNMKATMIELNKPVFEVVLRRFN
jgi:hypothetical protein